MIDEGKTVSFCSLFDDNTSSVMEVTTTTTSSTSTTTSSTSSTTTSSSTTNTSTSTTTTTNTSTTIFSCKEDYTMRNSSFGKICVPDNCFLKVPFYKQEHESWCGPAVVQMISEYYSISRLQSNLANSMRTDEVTTCGMLVKLFEDFGFRTIVKKEDEYDDIYSYVHETVCLDKNPLVVLQRLNTDDQVNGHYRIIVGLDDKRVYFLDSTIGLISATKEDFNNLWKKNQNVEDDNVTIMPKPV